MCHNICIAGLISLSSGLPLTSSSSILQRVRVSVSLCIRARVLRHFYLPSLSALNYSSSWGLCVLVSVTLAGSSQSRVNAHAGACACCDLTLSVLSQVVIKVAHQQQPLSLFLIISSFFFHFPPSLCFSFGVKVCVWECVYVGPFLDYAFSHLVLEFMRGPDRGIMDGGAWLPLRIRYLPRWHHTGSYQFYPGEEIAGALNTCFSNWRKCRFCSHGSNEANMLTAEGFHVENSVCFF